jgi:hypothetical protein
MPPTSGRAEEGVPGADGSTGGPTARDGSTGTDGLSVEVRSLVAGAPAGQDGPDPVLLRLLDERLTLAELIRRTVEEQVRELIGRRRLDAAGAQRVLDRQYLTRAEVDAQAGVQGAVRFPSRRAGRAGGIDPGAEVQRALDGFRQRSYHVFVDGRQAESLDEVVRLDPGTRVTFLRLTPLAGG